MSDLRLIPLGGMGNVTQNMYVYEYEDEMLLVDCGIGFPDVYMPGVDVLIPDISYILKQVQLGKTIVGMVLSHGHDDHIGALPYLLPEMPSFPIYGSPLTAGFAKQRISDKLDSKEITVLTDRVPVKIGKFFRVTTLAMTHSVPDTKHLVIETPVGLVYHGSDFKLDTNPVDGVLPDYAAIEQVGSKSVMLMLIDSLRSERSEWGKSESTVGPVLEDLMSQTKGKYVVTLMSSHIHRIQQVIRAAEKLGRKIVLVGRSVEQNVKVSVELGKLKVDRETLVDKKYIADYSDNKLCIIIAGSQGQEGSSLVRAVYGEHREVQLGSSDTVVFSADVIPGNEVPYYRAIDELSRNGIQVIYPDINKEVHQSGHAAAPEQQKLLGMVRPKFVMPIGGADRHRARFTQVVAKPIGYTDDRILIPKPGEVLSFNNGEFHVAETLVLNPSVVDGLGIGDVGPVVLSDRLSLAQAGMIVIIIPKKAGQLDLKQIEVVSRGFVFMKQADEVVKFIKTQTAEIAIKEQNSKEADLKKLIERRLARKLYKIIKREPLIDVTILNVD